MSDPPSTESVPKVLYIAGWGRSGSTVLDQILGQIDGWVSCGELSLIWQELPCGCGKAVHECELWRSVLGDVFGHPMNGTPEQLLALQPERLRTSRVKLASLRRTAAIGRLERQAAQLLDALYAGVARATQADVVVDSSKLATHAYLLAALSDVDLYVVHLVRDPRATAYAWTKRKVKSYDPLHYFSRLAPTRSSLYWLRRNVLIETLLRRRLGPRYLRLRYEDLIHSPEAAVRSICALVGAPDVELPFVDERTVRLHATHIVGGNPARFRSGEVQIRPDDEWRRRMPGRARVLSTLVAAPLMRRYDYPLRASRSR